MADSSGSDADGTYSGQQVLARPGALPGDPDPSTGYSTCCSGIGTATPSLPLDNGPRSVEAWVKTTSSTAYQTIAGYGVNGVDQAFTVSVSHDSINVDADQDDHVIPTPRPVDDGAWHLVTVTYDGAIASAYLDGQLAGTAKFRGPLDTLSGALELGYVPFGGYGAFNGELQDVAVYPIALSAARVAAHFAASGYSRPSAAHVVHAAYGGPNGAQITWGPASASNAPVLGYLVSVVAGANKGQTVDVPGDATGDEVGGLASGSQTFQVVAFNSYGFGPPADSTFTVLGASSTYASIVLADRPSAFYRLDDSLPSVMADSSGNGANGVYNAGNVTLGVSGALPGDPGTAVAGLGNLSGYASSASAVVPVFDGPRSVELWVKSTTDEVNRALVSWGKSGTDNAFAVIEESPTELGVDGDGDLHVFQLPYALDDGVWHMVTVSSDGSAITVYLDGRSVGSGHFDNELDTLPGPLDIGEYLGGYGLYDTSLDDLSIYPVVLSAAQVAAQFAASGYSVPTAPGAPAATAGVNRASVSWTAATAANAPVEGYLVTALKGGGRAGGCVGGWQRDQRGDGRAAGRDRVHVHGAGDQRLRVRAGGEHPDRGDPDRCEFDVRVDGAGGRPFGLLPAR